MKLWKINILTVGLSTLAAFHLIYRMPTMSAKPPASLAVTYRAVAVPTGKDGLTVSGAWVVDIDDRRLQGLSGLALRQGRLSAVSDLGAVVTWDLPGSDAPMAQVADLRDGPGPFGSKKNRDAEAIAPGRDGGWFVAYEYRHSVWQYDGAFGSGRQWAPIDRPRWDSNIGIEALVAGDHGLIAIAQSGREILLPERGAWRSVPVDLGWQVADAARAPDGSTWLLLRSVTLGGFDQAIAALIPVRGGYRLGPIRHIAKNGFDNFEGMVIEPTIRGWRFWLVSDDGHYLWPHTVLMALDLPRTQENARR